MHPRKISENLSIVKARRSTVNVDARQIAYLGATHFARKHAGSFARSDSRKVSKVTRRDDSWVISPARWTCALVLVPSPRLKWIMAPAQLGRPRTRSAER